MYLYLNEKIHVDNWIHGGLIPLNLASKYRSTERVGVYTPDENKHISIEGENIQPLTKKIIDQVIHNAGKGTIEINGNVGTHDGKFLSTNVKYKDSFEDGLIICFSTILSKNSANKFNKSYCVEIKNIHALKTLIDKQLGEIGEAGKCNYTTKDDRNHFLKSEFDAWQSEYRIVWRNIKSERFFNLPSGLVLDRTHMIKT